MEVNPKIRTFRSTIIYRHMVDRVGNDPTSKGFQSFANPSQLSVRNGGTLNLVLRYPKF